MTQKVDYLLLKFVCNCCLHSKRHKLFYFTFVYNFILFSLKYPNFEQSQYSTLKIVSRLIRADQRKWNIWYLTQLGKTSSKGNWIYLNKNARSKKLYFQVFIIDTLAKMYWSLHFKLVITIKCIKNWKLL